MITTLHDWALRAAYNRFEDFLWVRKAMFSSSFMIAGGGHRLSWKCEEDKIQQAFLGTGNLGSSAMFCGTYI